jgi:hypothetical protein
MKRPMLLLVSTVAVLGATAVLLRTSAQEEPAPGPNRVLMHGLDIERGRVARHPKEQMLSSGVMYAALEAAGDIEARVEAAAANLAGGPGFLRAPELAAHDDDDDDDNEAPSRRRTQGCSNVFHGNGIRNVRVNQDCSFRRQAEEAIAVNPNDPSHLIAGYNDSRIGFNHGGYAWSFDRGRTWGDMVPPFWGFLMADGHTSDAFSDPTATFDAASNAYISNVLFDVFFAPSAITVVKSNAEFGGTFYHTTVSGPFQKFSVTNSAVVSDNNPDVFHDKEFIVADSNPASPKANNLYVTWTRFDFATGFGVGIHTPIFFSQSTNGGQSWSAPIEISGANPAFCAVFSGSANPFACDQDQGSHPIVGPDGTVYVSFGNGNTPLLGINQTMIVSCPAAANCALPASWSAPVKIADLIGTHPIGPSPAGCPPGRQCLPPNGYRVPEFTSGSLSVDHLGRLYFVWSDFRNGAAPCTPLSPAAAASPPCDNDVFFAFSTNGGVSWSGPINIAPAARFGPTAQWQPWSAVEADGENLFVGYYDRSYGACEFTGCNDITVARIKNPASPFRRFRYRRITTSSMPNLTRANNPAQAGFLGDYMWVAVDQEERVHVVWADTRGREGTVEEDVYYASLPGSAVR